MKHHHPSVGSSRTPFIRFACLAAALLLGALAGAEGAAAQRLTIEGRVWEDLDGDEARGADERSLAEVRVLLFRGDRQIDETLTDGEGAYRFRRLRPDTYRLLIDESTLPLDLRFGQGERIYDVSRPIANADFGFVPEEVAARLRRQLEESAEPSGAGGGDPGGTGEAAETGGASEEPSEDAGATPEPAVTLEETAEAGREERPSAAVRGASFFLWALALLALVVLALVAHRLMSAKPKITLERLLLYRDAQEWGRVEAAYHALPESVRTTSFARQQRAFALNRAGDGERAERLLRELLESEGPSPETCGMLGRIFKDRWEAARDAGDVARAAEMLDKAIGHYLDGHQADPSDPYPGINALTLMESLPEPPGRRDSLLAEVRGAAAGRTSGGYWDEATRLELAILLGDERGATVALDAARAAARTPWQAETTRRNLRLQREGREGKGQSVPDWARSAEAELG